MNKLYLTVPLVLLLAFGGVYYNHSRHAEARAAAAQAAAAQVAAAQAAEKEAAERQAREDADRRAAERLAEEKKKEDEKAAKWAAAGARIETDTTTYTAQAAQNAGRLKTLEAELVALRAEKARATEATFELDLEVEKARIAKRTAELEIQRLVEMTARKAGTSLAPAVATP